MEPRLPRGCWGRDDLAWEPVRVERSTFVTRLLIYY